MKITRVKQVGDPNALRDVIEAHLYVLGDGGIARFEFEDGAMWLVPHAKLRQFLEYDAP